MTFGIIRSKWTKRDLMKASEAPGKPIRRVTGGWIADMVALRKCLTLCWACERKFDAKRNGYRKLDFVAPGHRTATGTCDGCKHTAALCYVYVPRDWSWG